MYRLIAKDRIFCEGTLAECQKTLSEISIMMDIVPIDYEIEEFLIIIEEDE